jgi:hypothetical protein
MSMIYNMKVRFITPIQYTLLRRMDIFLANVTPLGFGNFQIMRTSSCFVTCHSLKEVTIDLILNSMKIEVSILYIIKFTIVFHVSFAQTKDAPNFVSSDNNAI